MIPDVVVEKFEDMSNSGGSWGPDGHLYLSGHDPAEAYVMDIPTIGSTLSWIGTVPLAIAGQGIAWDRSQPDVIYGFVRSTNTVSVNKVDLSSLQQALGAVERPRLLQPERQPRGPRCTSSGRKRPL